MFQPRRVLIHSTVAFQRIFGAVGHWIAPPACLACGRFGANPWCEACRSGVGPSLSPDRLGELPVYVLGAYEGSLAKAIRRFKYEPQPSLASDFARLLWSRLQESNDANWVTPPPQQTAGPVWVPVPLHFERLVERGFNQAALLAGYLARRSGNPCRARLLERVRQTEQQAQLGQQARERNMAGAFRLRERAPATAILVDDVVTTGATISACERVLAAHGTRTLAVVAIARAT